MKRFISILATLVLTIYMFSSTTVFAAGNGTMSMSSATAAQGSTVTLNVNLNSNPGLVTMGIKVSYDESALQLTKVEDTGVLVGTQLNTSYKTPYQISWVDGSATSNNTRTGAIVKFTFKVLDSATVGNTTVTLHFVDSYDTDYNENTFSATSGKITITCKSHSYGSWSKASDTQHKHSCTACGHEEKANHIWNSGTVTTAASCKETGVKTYTCTTCNATKTETIAKTSNHSYGSWKVTKEATCTETGTQTRTCSVCLNTETSTINAKGHSFGSWSQTSAPSCNTQGQQKRTCTRNGCSHSETKTISALGHEFSNPTVTKQPTCTETGVETGTCTRCNQKTTNTIKATGHKYGSWSEVTAATCTAQGQEERVCSKCSQKETRAIDALGHDFESPTIIKEATLSATGLMEGKCKRCNEATQEVIPCKAEDTTTGISIEATEGVFAEGTTTNFVVITKDDGNYESVKNAVADKGSKFVAYNIQYMLNGVSTVPNREYTLLLPNADKVSADSMLVLHIAEDGTVTKKEFTVSEDDKIAVKTTESGTYVVVDKSTTEESKDDVADKTDGVIEDKNANQSLVWIIVGVAILLVAGSVVTVLIIKKKKNK